MGCIPGVDGGAEGINAKGGRGSGDWRLGTDVLYTFSFLIFLHQNKSATGQIWRGRQVARGVGVQNMASFVRAEWWYRGNGKGEGDRSEP